MAVVLSAVRLPASGFYEWKAVGGKKQPYYIRPKDDELFGLAGITELWRGPEDDLRSVCLITTEPNELMRPIHDRMPVIVPREDYAARLDPENRDPKTLQMFLRPFPAAQVEAFPVGRAVSNAKNEGAELIEPVQ
jgi:putative SOS response-associated peptidase YedK